ncbi:MAG: methyl-accepting chemotaxis protein [Desulfobacteraceae bacterium]|jgi:methyl-accepting chemotaxis protein
MEKSKKLEALPGHEASEAKEIAASAFSAETEQRLAKRDLEREQVTGHRGSARRLAIRKKKLAEDAIAISEELQAETKENAVNLSSITDRIAEMEQHIVGSNEAAERNLNAAKAGTALSETFQQQSSDMEQVLTDFAMVLLKVQGDIQGFMQVTDRLVEVSNRIRRYMTYLAEDGKRISATAEKVLIYADEIKVLSFNVTLESDRIGDKAAAVAVVAGHFQTLSQQAVEAASEIQQFQTQFDSQISTLSESLATLDQAARKHSKDSAELAERLGNYIENTKQIQKTNTKVQHLAAQIQQNLELFSTESRKIRDGIEEMSSSVAEISAGLYEQNAAMSEIATRGSGIAAMSVEYRQSSSEEAIDTINQYMTELNSGIQQTRNTIHQIVEAIYQIASSASAQQVLSQSSGDILQHVLSVSSTTSEHTAENRTSVEELTYGLTESKERITGVLEAFDHNDKMSNDITTFLDDLRKSVDLIEISLHRLQNISISITTMGFSGEVEAARIGYEGEGFSSISREIYKLGELSTSLTLNALQTDRRAQERIRLLKESIANVSSIVRSEAEQRRTAQGNLDSIAKSATELSKKTTRYMDVMQESHESFNQMFERMSTLQQSAETLVHQSSETMEFARAHRDSVDELAETVAAFSGQFDSTMS